MYRVFGILSIAVVSFLGGCTTAGPAGQPGQTGQTGQQGQSGQAGQAGQAGQTGTTGQTGDTGKAAPCPAGQHRSTSEAGTPICVVD
ncbi:MAG: hypothetical protein NTW74_07470 [Acidobacteria bacterium]|nr:hypothetical protein [Acidobacteriota bacterium]